MKKELKYLSAIPLYGTCILLIYLFVLSIKEKISKKKFLKVFIVCAVSSAICWYMVMMIIYIISQRIIPFDFYYLGIILTLVVAGYLINAFSFTLVDKKWNYLTSKSNEESSFLDVNKKKILLIAFVLAIVITVLTLVTILALGLV